MLGHFYISISARSRAILLIGLTALTLFVVGPLAGSIDDDEDGSPDIPVVVSDPVVFLDLWAHISADKRSGKIHDGVSSGHRRISIPGTTISYRQFLSVDTASVLHSCCSLRC